MATSTIDTTKAKCVECKGPVIVSIPAGKLGNAWGQEWWCKKCGKNPEKIIISPSFINFKE